MLHAYLNLSYLVSGQGYKCGTSFRRLAGLATSEDTIAAWVLQEGKCTGWLLQGAEMFSTVPHLQVVGVILGALKALGNSNLGILKSFIELYVAVLAYGEVATVLTSGAPSSSFLDVYHCM